MDESDEALMLAYRAGDAAAFDRLYGRYKGPVYRYVVRLSSSDVDADALFQDVWMRVVQRRDQWHKDKPLAPWLYAIARNRVVDHWRAEGQHQAVDMLSDELSDEAPRPDLIQHLRDCVERLLMLLKQLPAAQRDAFLLREEAGLSLADIAEASECGRETVKSRLRYAMKRLRSGLEGCDE